MLPGPVFNVELFTSARRARYYVIRFLYGAILLFLIWQQDPDLYRARPVSGPRDMTIQDMAGLGQGIFYTFVVTQSIAILFLTPALVAGVIADEKQRKTLHYLLASRLTSGEIVFGKLAARLLHVGVFLTLGVPIMSLISLFGGVPHELILLTYAATCSTAFFLAALSVLVSTYARRPREAITLVYFLELAWLFLPSLLSQGLPALGPRSAYLYELIRPLNQYVEWSNPFGAVVRSFTPWSAGGIFENVGWMIGLQLGYGVAMVLWSVVRLRPVFRKAGERLGWLRWFGARPRGKRLLPRPECGEDAMLWKERYVSRMGLGTKLIGGFILSIALAVMVYAGYWLARPAFEELVQLGYGTGGWRRDDLNRFLRVMATLAYLGWVLGITGSAASSVTGEREEDTWISLTSTPLSGWEIIRAKMFGAVWGSRLLGVVLLLLGALGLTSGALHPFGFVAVLVETLVFVWFTTALGTFLSLRSRTSTRAMTAAIVSLLVLNGGYLLCCIPLQPESPLVLAGSTPYVEVASMLTYREMWSLFTSEYSYVREAENIMTCLASTVGYAAAAALLTVWMATSFDEFIDRPRRPAPFSPAQGGETESVDAPEEGDEEETGGEEAIAD